MVRPIDVFRLYYAQQYADKYSHDIHTHIGAIAFKDGKVLACGTNVYEEAITPERLQRPLKYEYITHAEINLLKQVDLNGAVVYVTACPCRNCANALIEAGVVEVIYGKSNDPEVAKRWSKSWAEAEELFAHGGIVVKTAVV